MRRYSSTVRFQAVQSRPGAEVGGAGGDQLDGGVGPLHQLGGFEGELAIVLGAAVAHLPGAIHLVAEAPELDLPGIAAAVLAAQAGHGGVFGGIAVLDPLLGFGPGAGAEVGADVGLGAEHLDVVEELVGAEAVAFDGAPGHFEARRALVARADAVAPVVVGGEVAAGPAQQGDVELADGFEDVLAEAVGIGEGRLLFEDAAVDAAAEVLDEVAIEHGIDVADDALGIDLDARAEGGRLAAQDVGRAGEGQCEIAS